MHPKCLQYKKHVVLKLLWGMDHCGYGLKDWQIITKISINRISQDISGF